MPASSAWCSSTLASSASSTRPASDRQATSTAVFGILDVNAWHNLIHIATGVLGLLAFTAGARASRSYALGFGIVYIVVALWGFIARGRRVDPRLHPDQHRGQPPPRRDRRARSRRRAGEPHGGALTRVGLGRAGPKGPGRVNRSGLYQPFLPRSERPTINDGSVHLLVDLSRRRLCASHHLSRAQLRRYPQAQESA